MKIMKSVFTIFLFILSFVTISLSQTNISGNVSGVWTVDESPYIVTDNLILQPVDTLTIQPGVEVRFDGNYRFDIFGTFFAIGTETDSIKFTKNGDTKWMSLNFADACNDSSKIQYCIIEYGTSSGYEPYFAVLNCNSSSPNISNSTFRHNEKVIYNYGSDSKPIILKNVFIYNSGYAVNIEANSLPVVDSNIFTKNSSSCIYPKFDSSL